jgi:hypothetical protein
MNRLMSEQVNYKFLIDEELNGRVEKAFEAQGINKTLATTRLLESFLELPESLRLVILKQARGDFAKMLAEYCLRELAPAPRITDAEFEAWFAEKEKQRLAEQVNARAEPRSGSRLKDKGDEPPAGGRAGKK